VDGVGRRRNGVRRTATRRLTDVVVSDVV
jgi:hypothetical protein